MVELKKVRVSFVLYPILVLLMVGTLLLVDGLSQTKILGPIREVKQPSYGEFENFTIVSYSYLDGWDEPTEIRVSQDGKYAFTAHNPPKQLGASIIDISNPEKPRVVGRIEGLSSTHSQYVDVLGSILVRNQERVRGVDPLPKTWDPGIRLYDISDPTKPREVGFFKSDDPPGLGVHGFWLYEDSKNGKLAFLATSKQGYFGNILMIVDINDPSKPREVSRWWYPGTWTAGGEKPGQNWIGQGGLGAKGGLPNIWVYLHDITTYKDRAYLSYRDQGVIILDISDITKPTMISQIKWSPPEEGNTHSIGVVVPEHGGRPDLIIAADEVTRICPWGYMHIIDVRNERNPVQISTFRLPLNRVCPPGRPGERFGIHDIDRMIRGNIVFGAWENSGFWAVDISDPHQPKSAGYFVPPPSVRAKSDFGHADDVFVHPIGLIFATSSDPGGGLWILKYTPGVKGAVSWAPDKRNIVVKYQNRSRSK